MVKCWPARARRDADETRCWMEGVMKTEISGKEAARVAEDMAKPGPIRVVEAVSASEAQEAPKPPNARLGKHAPQPAV
jgi:hypothetical protein